MSGENSADSVIDTSSWSTRQILDDNEKILQEQGNVFDQMYDTIKNTKNIAEQIGTETEEQVSLLHDMNNQLDRNQSNMHSASRQIRRVQIKSSTKCLWCIIFLLLLLFIVVVSI